MAKANFGNFDPKKQMRAGKWTAICPKCKSDLQLSKYVPGGMMVRCTKDKKAQVLPGQDGGYNHFEYTCGFVCSVDEALKTLDLK